VDPRIRTDTPRIVATSPDGRRQSAPGVEPRRKPFLRGRVRFDRRM